MTVIVTAAPVAMQERSLRGVGRYNESRAAIMTENDGGFKTYPRMQEYAEQPSEELAVDLV